MIIRGIEVENWRCIPRVSLQELPAGIVVLHGPNRIGKSSLFEAVRSCLYDYDHDSGSRALANVVPWTTRATPKVTVDFEAKESRYRITKIFSRGQHGTARLERWTNGKWVVEVREPKEASRRARELLGTEKSHGGLNQLLWLEQGKTGLPESNQLDTSLEERLENVLGTLVTGQDLEFRKLLEERCGRWFTSTMKHRGGRANPSPVLQRRDQKHECEAALQEINKKQQEAEGLLRQFEDTEAEMAELERELEKSKVEVLSLGEEKEASRGRREAHERAKQLLEIAKEKLSGAEQVVRDYEETKERLTSAERKLHKAKEVFDAAKSKTEGLEKEYAGAAEEARKAREAEDRHAEKWKETEDRQRLLTAHKKLCDLDQTIQKAREYEKQIGDLQQDLSGPPAPSQEEVNRLRREAGEIRSLRGELQAAGLCVRVEPETKGTAKVSSDGGQTESTELRPGDPQRWQARQRIHLEIQGVARIQVGRGEEDLDLEERAKNLRGLEDDYRESVEEWQEDPDSVEALDRLTERRVKRESWMEQLQKLRGEMESIAPEGVSALESEKGRLERLKEAILKQRPEIRGWEPDEKELNQLRETFERERKRLMSLRKAAERKAQELGEQLERVRSERDNLRDTLTGEQISRDGIAEALKRFGDPESLKKDLSEAETEERRAQGEVEKTVLTAAERTIDERLAKANEALQKRESRLRQAQTKLSEYRGELRATEGLHTGRVKAEQELNAVIRALEEEELEAEAHALLLQLFESCRETQVRRTMGPIAGRVLEWAKHLGLDDYSEVTFGDDFLPKGLVRRDAGPDEKPIAFAEESHGTEEQLALLVRLGIGGVLARDEPEVAILDDPLAHSDSAKHRRMLDILRWAAEGLPAGGTEGEKPGRLQIFVLTCHPERFDYLPGARQVSFEPSLEK